MISSSNTTIYVRGYGPDLQPLPRPCSASSSQCSPCSKTSCSHMCLTSPSPDTSRRILWSTTITVTAASSGGEDESPAVPVNASSSVAQWHTAVPVTTSSTVAQWSTVGHKCACPTGVRLSDDGRTCRAGMETFLLLASDEGITRVSLETSDYTRQPLDPYGQDNDTRHSATDVDYDPVEDEIYWVDDEVCVITSILFHS